MSSTFRNFWRSQYTHQFHNILNHRLNNHRFIRSACVASAAFSLALSGGVYYNCVNAATFERSEVYSWGFNRYGQLGIGSETNAPLPTLVQSLFSKRIRSISCGAEQTAAITDNGKLYTFGRGQDSRLGHGESGGVNETSPKLVEELSNQSVVYVNAGYMHMAAITENGQVWTGGKNTYNQLGHAGTGDYPNPVPKLDQLGVKAVQVACGRYHTVVLADDGSVYAWGGFKSGETGTGEKKNITTPTKVQIDEKVVQIATGQQFTLFLTDKGEVFSCGAGDQGQTGHGASRERYNTIPTKIIGLSKVKRIGAGQFHSIACTHEGDVYTWGLNREGQLGHGDTQNRTTPSKVTFLCASNDDSPWSVVEVAAGGGHSACVCQDKKSKKRKLFVFGRGRQGQIGRANKIESVAAYRAEPVDVDFFDSIDCEIEQIELGDNHSAVLCLC